MNLKRVAYLVCALLCCGVVSLPFLLENFGSHILDAHAAVVSVTSQPTPLPPSLMENLGRGVIAVRSTSTDVFVSWRLLGTDPPDTSFNLYRSTGGGSPVLLNASPLTGPTNYLDSAADLTQANAYFVRPVIFGIEQSPSTSFTLPGAAAVQQYLRVPLQVPAGGTTPVGETYTYSPNDVSVGDLDGDGEYEYVVKWDPSNSKDNSQSGFTGNVYLDAYKLDGTQLWRIDLGRNIRAGAHYTQFMVYDLDGDGKAEVACKTADGTIDGTGNTLGDPAADYRNSAGYVLSGPEFLTVFNGQTGGTLATASYEVPRGTVSDWGDSYGNRVDRFNAAIAYLDGQRPSLVMARGYYTRTVLAAWNWRNGQFTNIWTFDTGHTGTPNPYAGYRGQGNHNLSVGDVDGDGKDEITYGACAIDDDGSGLYTTGLGHGDALHMSDMDPDRPGLEVFQPHECPSCYGPNAAEFRDGRTGALIFGVQASGDIGRGVAFDVDPRYRGYEMWASGGTGGMYTAQQSTPNAVQGPRGVQISPNKPSINFGIWWDGDPLRELLDGTSITKWNWLAGNTTSLLSPAGLSSNNGTKATPNLSGDILGDWREEVIWRESGNSALRIYTTTIPTTSRIYTLMHDRQYREAIAWQNSGYNQPPHPGFFLGDGMAPPPTPNIVTSLSTLLGPAAPVFASISTDAGLSADDFVTNDPTLILQGTSVPNTVVTLTRFGVGVIGSATADPSGNWVFDYSGTALPNGDTLFSATATDTGNQTGPPTTPFRVTIDLVPPTSPVIVDVADEGSLEFTGTAEPGTVMVDVTLVGTGVIAGATVDGAGNWTVTYNAPLAPGSHSFTATATDLAGNTGPASAAVTIDTNLSAPIISAITDDTGSSSTDGTTADNTLLLNGTATAGHTITVKLLGGAVLGTSTADEGGHWNFDHTSTALTDGAYTFSASATNGVGTSASSPAFAVKVDTISPAIISVNRQNPTGAISSSASITFRVTLSESASGVDSADFTPVFSGGLSGSIANVIQAGTNSFDVTIALSGEGTVRLDVNASGTGIADTAGNLLSGGFTGGQLYTRSLTGNGIWIQNGSGGNWANNGNWLDGIVGAGIGSTADFTTLELVDDLVVNLDSPRTVGNIVFGDTDINSPGNWIVDNGGIATNTLNLVVGAGTPSIVVNPLGLGAATTMSVPLTGNQGLTKLGTGTLLLNRSNTLTGPLNVSAGILRIVTGGSAFAGGVNISTGGAILNIAGGSFTATGGLTVNAGAGSALIVDSGTAGFAGLATNNSAGGILRVNGGTVTATSVNIPRSSDATPSFASGFIVTGGNTTINGPVSLGTNNSWGSMSVEGGSLAVTGIVTLGNQASGGRGGQMRVTNGTFTSTNAPTGIVMCRNNGTNTNNVATATFTGGLSTVEKFTLGFDSAVTAGSATITLNGGALYLGSGSIVKNGAAGLATSLNFSSGILGAKADWSTALPINLPGNGNITFKSADTSDAPHNINFSGVLSGPGGFTKSGNGALVLGAANTFTGAVAVNEGTLDLDGSLASGAMLSINAGGTLTGDGNMDRGLILNPGGTVRPGSITPGSALTASWMLWNAGGNLAFELGTTSNQLAIPGWFASTGGQRQFIFTSGPGLAAGNTYTLATFGATNLTAGDLTFIGLPAGLTGEFTVTPHSITFRVFASP